MPVAIADGALGIEALHTWTPPQGIIPGGIADFTLNDRAALYSLATSGYAVKVKSITGLHSLPDLVDEREASLGRIGETVYDAEDSGKTVAYSGFIFGATLQKLREGSNTMRRTFQAKSREGAAVHELAQVGEGMMTITPHASYGTPTPVEHVYFGRTLSLDMGDEQQVGGSASPSPFQRAFVLTIRMADPRVYENTLNITDPQVDGASIFIDNQGSAPTEPIFQISGAFTSTPVVMARGTEYVLALENLDAIADVILVNFKHRTARLITADIDISAHLSVINSNWWDPGVHGLDPGVNDIGVTGNGVGGEWRVTWYHASV